MRTSLCPKCYRLIPAGHGIWVRSEKGLEFVHDQPECTRDVIRLTAEDLDKLRG